MNEYVERHLLAGGYGQVGSDPVRYENAEGWIDYRIGSHTVFAHRTTDYTAANFRDALHAHDYCEVLFWCRGDVQYVSGDRTEDPQTGCVIVIPPGAVHTTRLLAPSCYERYVLYFSADAYREYIAGLQPFLSSESGAFSCVLSGERLVRARGFLERTEELLAHGGAEGEFGAHALLASYLLLVREALSDAGASEQKVLPTPVREIRRYVETGYASITSVEEVASRFYYSREYVTRLFRRYYNLSPGDYIEQCRIRDAEKRIASGEKIADVCFAVGYRSISAFSSAFRRVTGKPPSAFRVRR